MLKTSNWPSWIAGRYLRTGRRDSFVRFLSWAAGLGIALGVAALILALSAMTGLQDAIRQEALQDADSARIEIRNLEREAEVRQALQPLVGDNSIARVVEGNGWLISGPSLRPVKIVGYSGWLPRAAAVGNDGAPPALGLVRVSRPNGVLGEVGEVLELATSRSRIGPLGPEPMIARMRVEGTTAVLSEATVYLNLENAQRLLGRSEGVELAVAASTIEDHRLPGRIRSALEEIPGVTVYGWESLQPGLWFALRLEKVLVFFAVFLIVLVAVLALVADLYMLVTDRRREIGILQALGAPQKEIRRAFQRFGLAIAAGGAMGGLVVGLLLAWVLDRTGWIRLPSDGYTLDHIPFVVRPLDVGLIAVSSLVLAWAVCWVATRGSAEASPVEALRR